MHARLSAWRVRPEDLEALSREIAPIVAEVKRQPGYIAGYELQTAPDTRMFVTIWESEDQLRAAFDQASPANRPPSALSQRPRRAWLQIATHAGAGRAQAQPRRNRPSTISARRRPYPFVGGVAEPGLRHLSRRCEILVIRRFESCPLRRLTVHLTR